MLSLQNGRAQPVGARAQTDGSSTTMGDHTMQTKHSDQAVGRTRPWNRGKLLGPKPPFKLKEIWAIRIRLRNADRIRDLALFNLAIDSKSYAVVIS